MISLPLAILGIAILIAWGRWSYLVWRDWYEDIH